MKDEFCNVICMVCKKEYIVKKSVLINGDYFYVCPTCRLYDDKKEDNINPDHYGNSGIDVIDFCQANNLDFMQGNVIKYIARYRKKNGLEDVRKAVEYINRILANEYPKFEAVVRTKGE